MPTDMNIWKERVKQAVNGLADEQLQRRAWFGIGPEESSPTEEVCQLVDDTNFEHHLNENTAGFNPAQLSAGKDLANAINEFGDRHTIQPEKLIDDPRWVKIRNAAQQFLKSLD